MKRSLFLSGALAIIILGASAAPVMAQTNSRQETRLDRMAEKLDLTEAQKDRVKQIFSSSRTQMRNVLTAEQKEQLQTARESGMRGRRIFRSLNLSETQKQQIKTIRQNTRQEISKILTPEQRQTMEEMRQNRRQNFQR